MPVTRSPQALAARSAAVGGEARLTIWETLHARTQQLQAAGYCTKAARSVSVPRRRPRAFEHGAVKMRRATRLDQLSRRSDSLLDVPVKDAKVVTNASTRAPKRSSSRRSSLRATLAAMFASSFKRPSSRSCARKKQC